MFSVAVIRSRIEMPDSTLGVAADRAEALCVCDRAGAVVGLCFLGEGNDDEAERTLRSAMRLFQACL